jgi:molybdenum cofactor cytidylyltransferase
MTSNQVTAVILAAGSSSRLGTSKQLLLLNGTSLIRRTIQTFIDTGIEKIIVVLGADYEKHFSEISDLKITILQNEKWPSGLGSSIRNAIQSLDKTLLPEALILSVCDLPLLNTNHITSILNVHYKTNKGIVASGYSETKGVPALFSKLYFGDLSSLSDDQGAKHVINKYPHDVALISFPEGQFDIDTVDDIERLKRDSGFDIK